MATIRKAASGDIINLLELESQLFSPPYSEADLHREIFDNPYSSFYVLEENQKILGFFIIWVLFNQAQIIQLGVKKAFQGQGIANRLMSEILTLAKDNDCESISLEVRVSNKPAIALYTKHGFENVATRKDYYRDPSEDAYLLWRLLI